MQSARFAAKFEYLDEIRDFLGEIARERGFRDKDVYIIQLATDEAASLAMAVLVIFLVLSANFQSLRLGFVVLSTTPAVLTGVVLARDRAWLLPTAYAGFNTAQEADDLLAEQRRRLGSEAMQPAEQIAELVREKAAIRERESSTLETVLKADHAR